MCDPFDCVALVDDLTVLDRGHKGYGGDVGSQWDRVDPTTKALTGAILHVRSSVKLHSTVPEIRVSRRLLILFACTGATPADACYASGWRDKLESMLYGVTDAANLSIVLTDGPYGGGVCGATNHTHHVRSSVTFQRHSM